MVEIFLPSRRSAAWRSSTRPGLNSILPEHERVTRDFLQEADAIVWVFAIGQAAKATEKAALELAHGAGKRVLGVLNKVDRADASEIDAVVEHVARLARRAGRDDHPVLRHARRSGARRGQKRSRAGGAVRRARRTFLHPGARAQARDRDLGAAPAAGGRARRADAAAPAAADFGAAGPRWRGGAGGARGARRRAGRAARAPGRDVPPRRARGARVRRRARGCSASTAPPPPTRRSSPSCWRIR